MNDKTKKKSEAQRLGDLDLHAVAFVSAGAQMREFFIRKHKENNTMDKKVIEQIMNIEADNEAEIMESFSKSYKNVSNEGISAARSAYRLLSAYSDNLPEGALDAVRKAFDGTSSKAIETLSEVEKGKLKWVAEKLGLTEDELKTAVEQAKKNEEEEEEDKKKAKKSLFNQDGSINEDIAKSYPDDVRDELVSLAKVKVEQDAKLAAIEKARANEQEEAKQREYIEKASQYKQLGADPKSFGPVLKSLDEKLEKEHVDVLTDLLGRLSKLVEKSKVFEEIGKATTEEDLDAPMVQLKKTAEEIHMSEPSLTKEQAFARACTVRKDLVAKYYHKEN